MIVTLGFVGEVPNERTLLIVIYNDKFFNYVLLLTLFHATGLLLYPGKTENLWFSNVFRGYRKRSLV